LKDLGVIDKNKLIEVQRTELVSDHIGGTAQKTLKAIKRAEGGVMFIDEAYRLSSSSNKDYGKEAIETVMSKMTPDPDGVSKLPVFIFAGYKEGMKKFVKINAGLKRRIKNHLVFEDFSSKELVQITEKKMIDGKKKFPLKIDEMLHDCFGKIPRHIVCTHNAALCVDLIDFIQTNQESRLPLSCSINELDKFTEVDIKKGMDDFLCSLTSTDERVVSISTMKESVKTAELGTITEFEVFFPEVVLNIPGCEKARLSGP